MSAAMFTAVFYAGRRANEHLAGLGYGQRRAVIRAVRRGQPVSDPALAEVTIRHAQLVQGGVRTQRLSTVLASVFLAASVVGLGAALAVGSAAGTVAAAFSLVVWIVILVLGPRVDRRAREKARAAELKAAAGPSGEDHR